MAEEYIKWMDAMRKVVDSCLRLQEDFANGVAVLTPLPDNFNWQKAVQLKVCPHNVRIPIFFIPPIPISRVKP